MNSPTIHHPSVTEGTFSGANNLTLFYRSWYPSNQAAHNSSSSNRSSSNSLSASNNTSNKTVKGVLALIHGLGEHSGRYCPVSKALTAAGYAVFAFDNQGHGKSEGQRGHITRWQDYRDNTQTFLKLIRTKEPTAPLFLMGHSLGGLIVLDYILRNEQCPSPKPSLEQLPKESPEPSTEPSPEESPKQSPEESAKPSIHIKGVVVSAPPVQPSDGTANKARIIMARLLSGLLPRFSLDMGLNRSGLSRDQKVAAEVAHDPLNHPYVTLRWGSETLSTMKWVNTHIEELRCPILLIHGEADPIMDYEGSCKIYQKIQTPNKTIKIYEGSYHEPHNDLDAEKVMTDLVNWLDQSL